MIDLRNIFTVAAFERKTLFRSWFFRIFALITLLVLFSMNMGIFVDNWSHWTNKAIPSNLPYTNVLFVNVAQAIIAVFLASEFLKRDKKLDTTEVIYARPISNGEYVVGKTFGIITLFVALVFLILTLSMVINLVVKDVKIVWEAYLLYPLLITIPTLIYILGLSFFLMILFRSQAVTFIVLLAYIGLTLFYFEDRLNGTLDYMAFNLPMVYSDIIHFADLKAILLQRGSYFLLGMGFIFGTIRFLGRLPQTGKLNIINSAGFIIFLAAGLFMAYSYYSLHSNEHKERARFLSLNNEFAGMPSPDILTNSIFLEQHETGIRAKAEISFRNTRNVTLDTLIFSLNPGLFIDSITSLSGKIPFERIEQIIRIVPEKGLAPFRRNSYTFYYSGSPVEHIAYLDISKREWDGLRKIFQSTLAKKTLICSKDYLLLTPEVQWYPIAGVGFNKKNFLPRDPDFSRFSLEVATLKGLLPVSSGEAQQDSLSTHFINTQNLAGISLAIGNFEERSLLIDDTEFKLYLKPGHDYFSKYFDKIMDTIPDLIKEEMENYEYDELDLYYAFDRVKLIETPAQFYAYERPYTTSMNYIQPEMILLPERGAGCGGLNLSRRLAQAKESDKRRENARSEEEIQIDLLKRLLRTTFFSTDAQLFSFRGPGSSGEAVDEYRSDFKYSVNPYCVFPLFYDQIAAISSDEYPIFNAMIQLYLRDGFDVSFRQSFRGGVSDNERANLALKGSTLEDVFARRGNDLVSSVITQASAFIIQALRNKVGIEEFDYFLYYYIEDHQFSEIIFDDFARDFYDEFKVDIKPYLAFISSENNPATFQLSTPEYILTRDDYGDVYVVRMKISNIGESMGLINFTFRMPGQGGFGGGSSGSDERIYEVAGGETKEIQMLFYDQPRMMSVNTLISGNIPSSFSIFLRSATSGKVALLEDYEISSTDPVSNFRENEFIVDNEDEGFSFVSVSNESKVKQYIDSKKDKSDDLHYEAISPYRTPAVWTPVAHSAFYGESIRSALVCRKGDGGNMARWSQVLPEAGFYDVYAYIPVSAMYKGPGGRDRGQGGRQRGGGGGPRGPEFADRGTEYFYNVSSNEGTEVAALHLDRPEEGWNKIGSFHFPADTAFVELSNASNGGFRVIADAIKWIRKD